MQKARGMYISIFHGSGDRGAKQLPFFKYNVLEWAWQIFGAH